MDALCINPLFSVGIALGIGVCIGTAVTALFMLSLSSKVRLW